MKKLLSIIMIASLFLLTACSGEYRSDPLDGIYNNGFNGSGSNMDGSNDGETYAVRIENEFISVSDMPVSTFSTDVDTASYTNIRRMINEGSMPTPEAVRIEEMINYFEYDLEGPQGDEPIHVTSELSVAPWNENHQLLMLGVKAPEVVVEQSEGMNLVFLIDVSGSMSTDNKLPLLKDAFEILIDQLSPSDSISIVVYAGAAGVVLEGADSAADIRDALKSLKSGGSTAGGEGIKLAYEIAERHFIEGGNNRILIATDGDFNVGMSNTDQLKALVSEKRESGICLSVLGFGTGNIDDELMETLADNGNGAYFYIDNYEEAEKVFLYELNATLYMVAKDVKLQIEFNPANVKGYRLIGYENRILNYGDFIDDAKDAGDMGSGDVVIAFYEIIPANSTEYVEQKTFEDKPNDLRYNGENYEEEYLNLDIRYKNPEADTSELISYQVLRNSLTDSPSETFRFASSVVEFGLIIANSKYKASASLQEVLERSEASIGDDERGYRYEFYQLVQKVISLQD